jgi:hypothetical protein
MPTPRGIFLLALVAITTVSASFAVKPSAKPQEVFAPYWTSDPGWGKPNFSSKTTSPPNR